MAKIFGKPVYLVTDVAVLPLSSQQDAEQAIKALTDSSENIPDDSDSDASDGVERTSNRASLEGLSTTPADDVRPQPSGRTSTTKVAEDVATRNVSFGRFASQWFSRQNRSTSTPPFSQPDTASNEPKPAESDDNIVEDVERAAQSKDQAKEEDRAPLAKVSNVNATATLSLLPRILKTIKMIFTSGSYFFSYDVDLTRRLQDLDSINQPLTFSKLNSVVSMPFKLLMALIYLRSISGIVLLGQDCLRATLATISRPFCKALLVNVHSCCRNHQRLNRKRRRSKK